MAKILSTNYQSTVKKVNEFLSLQFIWLIINTAFFYLVKYAIHHSYGSNLFSENPEVLLIAGGFDGDSIPVSYTHLRAHET